MRRRAVKGEDIEEEDSTTEQLFRFRVFSDKNYLGIFVN